MPRSQLIVAVALGSALGSALVAGDAAARTAPAGAAVALPDGFDLRLPFPAGTEVRVSGSCPFPGISACSSPTTTTSCSTATARWFVP